MRVQCRWFGQISQLNFIPAAVRRLCLPPWKGKPIIAQDKRGTSAVLGKRPHQPISLFPVCPELLRGKTGKREVFILGLASPGGVACPGL